ncbi:MAG TPA: methyltransferase domain-containing protein [Chloroflexia bacterium]|nr:methyltransferase domain-containing protein [Chloroflexia bacterium]
MEYAEYKIMYEAEDTHWWYRGMRGSMFALLRLHADHKRELTILDAGCGTGGTLNALRKAKYSRLEGFDLNPIALEFCHKRGLDHVRLGSITDIPYPDDTFDIVISCDVVTDAGTDNEGAALRELYRVLRPGGRLFLNLPAFAFLRSEHDRATDVARRVTRREITARLEGAGFVVKRASYWNMFLFPVVVAVRLLRREAEDEKEDPARSDIVLPSGPVNTVLSALVRFEAKLMRYVNLPFGSSVVTLAAKPKDARSKEAGKAVRA